MAVRIEKDGWSVTGSTLDELQIGIQAVQAALVVPQRPPAAERIKGPGRPRGTGGKVAEQKRKKQEKRELLAIEFLRELRKHPAGILSSFIAKKLDINPRGIGNVFSAVEEMAQDAAIPAGDIFHVEKVNPTDSSKTITPREKIADAINSFAR